MADRKQHIYFSRLTWSAKWGAAQALSEALSKNDDVLFVSTFCNFFKSFYSKKDRDGIIHWLKGEHFKKVNKNLTIFYPPPLFHFGRSDPNIKFNEILVKLNLKYLAWSTKRFAEKIGFEEPIIWIEDFLAHSFRSIFKSNLLIYYIYDDYRHISNYNKKIIVKNEKKNSQICDLIVCVSKALEKRFKQYGAKILLTSIGVSSDNIIKNGEIHSPISSINNLNGRKIGFLGIADFNDHSLVEKIVKNFENSKIVFVGPLERNKRFLRSLYYKHNVKCFPTVNISDVPKVIAAFDVCILPFEKNEFTKGSDPMKMYDYLAGGKPVVAIKINEDMEKFNDVAYLCDNHKEFLEGIEFYLNININESKKLKKKQLKFIKEYTWESIALKISCFIDENLTKL